MRRSFLSPTILALLHLAPSTFAQTLAQELSFGHHTPLSPNGALIPGWQASSSRHNLQILSDRAILTPPVPGNAKGALWADHAVDADTWVAELEFRASGQDTGSGSLNLWLAKDRTPILLDSVYTAGRFDGLVVVVDQYGSTGGKIRAFLNDGTQDFKSHSNLESLAFGHCDYAYRNLGRPSKLTVSSLHGLSVSIDDRLCFSSEKVMLPSGYFFGITAMTGDQPDSFEVHKFITTTNVPHVHTDNPPAAQQQQQQQGGQAKKVPQLQKLSSFPGAPEAVPDSPADDIKSAPDQFADLHNRLQGLTHAVANILAELEALERKADERQSQVLSTLRPSEAKIDALSRRLENVERIAADTRKEVEVNKDTRDHLEKLNRAIEGVRGGVVEGIGDIVSASAPRMGMFVFIVLAVQVMLAGAYIVYKRRRATMPKKYL